MVRLDGVTELIMTHRGVIEMLESRKIIELVKDENKEDSDNSKGDKKGTKSTTKKSKNK